MAGYWTQVDTILMGRRTWEVAAAQSPAPKRRTTSARSKRPTMRTYVFSRTLADIDCPGVELVREDAAGFVAALKRQAGKRICLMGGGELAHSFIAAGLVDEIGLNIHPILLGSGVPVFRDPGRRVPLRLVNSRTIDGGCILANDAVDVR